MPETDSLTIAMPDDWHLHLRDGEILRKVLPPTCRHFRRAIIMPNLATPVVTSADALRYRDEIVEAMPEGADFQPLMTLYLTETTEPEDVRHAFEENIAIAVKLYPAGATTLSEAGVRSIEKIYPVLEVMADIGMPLLTHGEVVDPDVDIFDREAVFIEKKLTPIRQRFPELKIVLEHVTTADGVAWVRDSERNTAATITPHHLVINRNAMFRGGIRPHYYCLPVAKRETHRLALREAAISGDPRFFLGTDSAPHPDPAKESACGCAGIFNAPVALSIVAQVFDDEHALPRLEKFTSLNGPAFYSLPVNEKRLTLKRRKSPLPLPAKLATEKGAITVFNPEMPLYWLPD